MSYIKQVAPGDAYGGLVRGIVGNLLVLEARDLRMYVLPMKLLQGYRLTVAPTVEPMRLQQEPRVVRFES
jgi:hypothetical protein